MNVDEAIALNRRAQAAAAHPSTATALGERFVGVGTLTTTDPPGSLEAQLAALAAFNAYDGQGIAPRCLPRPPLRHPWRLAAFYCLVPFAGTVRDGWQTIRSFIHLDPRGR